VVATLNFAGTAGETQQFTVATLDDALLEGTETFTASLNASDALITDTDTGTGTITDNDTAAVRSPIPIPAPVRSPTTTPRL
jgi:hypothetical protein